MLWNICALGMRSCLDDMDVFRRRGLAHGRVPHRRCAPSHHRGHIGLARMSHHGHGLRTSLAFDPLHAVLSLRPGQRLADHDRSEPCGDTSRPRGRTVRRSPARLPTTAARTSAQSIRVSNGGRWRTARRLPLPESAGVRGRNRAARSQGGAARPGQGPVDRERAGRPAANEHESADRLRAVAGHATLGHVLQHARVSGSP